MKALMKRRILALAAIGMATVVAANVMAANPYTSPEAIAVLRKSAAAGDLSAIYKLGYTLQNDPDESNDLEGRDLMVEAANRGYWISAAQFGQYYLYGWADWAKVNHEANTAEAIRWLRRAGEMAPPEEDASYTYSLLGNLYSHTFMRQVDWTVAPLDETEAIKWYRLCTAAEGNPCAAALGRLLVKTPSGATEGIKWLLVGANNGDGWAMRDLGGLYAEGNVVRKDLVMAVAWYWRAAAWTPEASEGWDLVQDVRAKANELTKQLTPAQVQRANDMAAKFKPKTAGEH